MVEANRRKRGWSVPTMGSRVCLLWALVYLLAYVF